MPFPGEPTGREAGKEEKSYAQYGAGWNLFLAETAMNSNKKNLPPTHRKQWLQKTLGDGKFFLWFGFKKPHYFHLSSVLPFLCPSQEKWFQNPSPWRSLRMLFLIQPRLMSLFWVSNQRFLAQKGKSGASSYQGVV